MNPIDLPTRSTQQHPLATRRTETSDVAVLGLGYVGLPTALAFSAGGLSVLGIDVSQRRLADIAAGDVDLLDDDHARLSAVRGAELRCTDSPEALAGADAIIVCVPTPVDEQHAPDLRALRSACSTVLAHVRPGQLLVLTSTTSVGSTRELLVEPLERRGLRIGRDVFVAFAPERIDPGNATHPQEHVPRVVGGVTERCTERAVALLGRVAPVHPVSSPEAAELCKLHENTFRAVNIAYAYELAEAASAYDLDVTEVVDAASSKPFGFMAFHPSAGVGGHCIPCDPHYLLAPLAERGVSSPIVAAAMQAIAGRPGRLVERALELLDEAHLPRRAARVLVVGAAYKPGVADMRESPGVEVLRGLTHAQVEVSYHDPLIPTLDLGRRLLMSAPDPDPADFDLVVLTCVHPTTDPFWERGGTLVLDGTYRALRPADVRRRVV